MRSSGTQVIQHCADLFTVLIRGKFFTSGLFILADFSGNSLIDREPQRGKIGLRSTRGGIGKFQIGRIIVQLEPSQQAQFQNVPAAIALKKIPHSRPGKISGLFGLTNLIPAPGFIRRKIKRWERCLYVYIHAWSIPHIRVLVGM